MNHFSIRIFIFLLATIFFFGCQSNPFHSNGHHILVNSDIKHHNGHKFYNLYDAYFKNGQETELDKRQYLKPEEIEKKHYAIIRSPYPEKQIDRTKNYDPSKFQVHLDLDKLRKREKRLRITWLGHASFLIQFPDGTSILTDPVFGEMDGISGFTANVLGADTLKRVSAPVVSPSQLNFVDAIVISHDHYDHLSFNTLKNLDHNTIYLVPLGVQNEFPLSYKNVTAMDWYTSKKIAGVNVSFIPANHYSGRGASNWGETLWGGYIFIASGKSVFFAGDTGYSSLFNEIHEKFGDMDICLMPISAYFFRSGHFAPEDALMASEDLGCTTFIPWGYGTFILGHEHVLEPLRRLEVARKLTPPSFSIEVLQMGETWSQD